MKSILRLFAFSLVTTVCFKMAQATRNIVLFDFTAINTLDGWIESSDTVRTVGMSKANLVIQKTQVFQRAILFTLLNPQPNGAAFAGVNYYSNWNLSSFDYLSLRARGQGENMNYKIVLRHKDLNYEPNPSYEATFKISNTFENNLISFSEFKPFYRGKQVNDAPELDKSWITGFGIQVFGGVYLPQKQYGVSSLEIDTIEAISNEIHKAKLNS